MVDVRRKDFINLKKVANKVIKEKLRSVFADTGRYYIHNTNKKK